MGERSFSLKTALLLSNKQKRLCEIILYYENLFVGEEDKINQIFTQIKTVVLKIPEEMKKPAAVMLIIHKKNNKKTAEIMHYFNSTCQQICSDSPSIITSNDNPSLKTAADYLNKFRARTKKDAQRVNYWQTNARCLYVFYPKITL